MESKYSILNICDIQECEAICSFHSNYIQGVPIKMSDHIWFVNEEKKVYTKQRTNEKNQKRSLAGKLNRFDTISLSIVFLLVQ